MTPKYLNLRIGAARRLAILRLAADNWNKEHPHAPLQNPSWREMRFGKLSYQRGLSQGYQTETRTSWGATTETRIPVSVTHDGAEFRGEQFADEVLSLRHTGYYTDRETQDGTYRGIVARLPHGRFISGYYSSDNGERVYFPVLFDCQKEAARNADHEAEHYAEREAEYQTRMHEARALHDKIEEQQTRLRECLALRNDPRPCFAAMREEARECIEHIRTAMATLANDYAGVEV